MCEPPVPDELYPIFQDDDDTIGLVARKYHVERLDNRDLPGEKHHGCSYFVLDLTHDPFAIEALRAYAGACDLKHPLLASDLRAQIAHLELHT